MSTQILKKLIPAAAFLRRTKTTSAQYVSSRARDPTFEKLMEKYKNLLKVISIQDLILASPSDPPCVSLEFLSRLSQRLHLNRGPAAFLRNYPHVFRLPQRLHLNSGQPSQTSPAKNAYTSGMVRLVRCETEVSSGKGAVRTIGTRCGENGCFVLWRMSPGMWSYELSVAGNKVLAGSDGKTVWRHTPRHPRRQGTPASPPPA